MEHWFYISQIDTFFIVGHSKEVISISLEFKVYGVYEMLI